MRQILISFLLALLPLVVASAFTGEVEIDGIKYDISTKEKTAKVIGAVNPELSGSLIIPGSIVYEGKTCYVSSVEGFQSCTGITSIHLGEGITTIKDNAFSGCTNLYEIDIPISMRKIAFSAFEGTPWYDKQEDGIVYAGKVAYTYKGEIPDEAEISIKEGTISLSAIGGAIKTINLPASLRYISRGAFRGNTILKKISIPDSVYIDERAFDSCTGLEYLEIGNGVEVEDYTFRNCSNLKTIIIKNAKFLNADVNGRASWFYLCDNIETVELHCKEIGRWFANSTSLSNVILGDEVEVICNGAFWGCTNIKKVDFPQSIKYLSGFSECIGLSEITIPSNVETIGGGAFSGCIGITSLIIPSNVKEIEDYAFEGCTGLSSVVFSEGLNKIGGRAFSRCYKLTNIEIPNSVDSIGSVYDSGGDLGDSFADCKGLTSIILPPTMKELGAGTFSGCSELSSVILPEGITTIKLYYAYR